MNHRNRVGVVRGGPSEEYNVSIQTGGSVLEALRGKLGERYEAKDIFIDHDGDWYFEGMPILPQDIVNKVDVAFNALHGAFGEDGKIQAFFEVHGLPFTGSGSLGSAIGMNKSMTKKILKDYGVKSPYSKEISSARIDQDVDAVVRELFTTFLLPAVVKPNTSGSSIGVSLVKAYTDLAKALTEAARYGDSVLIEEFIPGIEATCGVIEGFRGQELYALPPIEIRSKNALFDFEAKYAGKSEKIVPSTFVDTIKESIQELSKKIHNALGLRHYSRSDFIVHPRRGIYVLETNTLPGLTYACPMPKAMRAVGSDTHELVDHVIGLAMKR